MAEAKTKSIYERLAEVQAELKAPKGQYNTHGKFNYRSAEDILEAVKPLNKKHGLTLVVSDELVHFPSTHELQTIEVVNNQGQKSTEVIGGDRFYIKATATLYDVEGNSIPATAFARETQNKKGMDDSQVTGSTSSYARKYALNGLYNIDDTKDADTDEQRSQTQSTHPASQTSSRPASNTAKATPAPGDGGSGDVKCEIPSCHNTVWASRVEKSKEYNKGHVICYFHSTNGDWEKQLTDELAEQGKDSSLPF